MDELLVCQLGIVEYTAAVALQERIRDEVLRGERSEVLLLLEHSPVYTRGRRSDDSELPRGEDWYRARGIDIVQTDRGGKLTYHGPGQLVGYPIMRIDDVIAYLRTIERAIMTTLREFEIEAHTREGRAYTGVWVDNRKIASIGLHLQRGITTHGFAVNVDNDLSPFEWVTACGLADVQMTSIAQEVDSSENLARFRTVVVDHFCGAIQRRAKVIPAAELGLVEELEQLEPIATH